MNINRAKETAEETNWRSLVKKAIVIFFGVLMMVVWPISMVTNI
jgi:hypothetical protein